MINNGTIGIVMRTKNRNVLLRRAIESVINQSFQDWKLVIINDGGDVSAVGDLVSHYTNKSDGRVSIHHNLVSIGMEAASNIGLSLLNTEMVVIHDDDDSWAPEFLSRMFWVYSDERKNNPSIGGISCYCHRVSESVIGNVINILRLDRYNQHLESGILPLWQMIERNRMPPICFLFSLTICRKIGGFDPTLPVLGDWDFHLRFMLENDIWILPESLAFYHHRENVSGSLGNSLTAGIEKHLRYRTILENQWLRRDIESGKFGIGSMIALSHLGAIP